MFSLLILSWQRNELFLNVFVSQWQGIEPLWDVTPLNRLGLLVRLHLRDNNPRLIRSLEIKYQPLVYFFIIHIDFELGSSCMRFFDFPKS